MFSSEVKDIVEVRDNSLGRVVIDKGLNIDWNSIKSFTQERLYRSCCNFNGVNFSSDKFSSIRSKRHGLLKGIDRMVRPF